MTSARWKSWLIVVLAAFAVVACSADPGSNEADGPVGTRPDAGELTDTGGTLDPDVTTTETSDDVDSGTTTTTPDPDTGLPPDDTGTTQPDVPPSRGGFLVSDPDNVFFSYFEGDGRSDELVTLTNRGDGPLHITEIVLEDAAPGFNIFDNRINIDLAPMETTSFTVRFEPGEDEFNEGMVRVYMTDEDPLEIPILASSKGTVPATPRCIETSTANVNFGSIVRGVDPDGVQTFDIRNCGESEITVSRLDRGSVFFTPTPTNFQWTPEVGPIVIPPGEFETVTVTFTPGRVGRVGGKIDIRSNVEGSETISVNLNAIVERPPIGDLDLHLLLRWDQDSGSDVDFHFMPVGTSMNDNTNDCYFGNMEPDWGVAGDYTDNPFLDLDDLEGPGPENINVDELVPGQYLITVYYYSDTGSGSGDEGMSVSTNATVEVYIHGTLVQTYGPHYLGSTGDRWDVAVIDWPSGTLSAP